MKFFALVPACLLLTSSLPAADLWNAFHEAQHRVQSDGGNYRADNPESRLSTMFTHDGITAVHPGGELRMGLTAYGYGDLLRAPAVASIHASGTRVEYRRGTLVEWYSNEERGLEQGFTLSERPTNAGGGPLTLELGLSGDLTPVLSGSDVRLERDGHEVLRYAGLRAWDADLRPLPAHIAIEENRIRLRVDDAAARYPVTIDPWIQQQKLSLADGAAADYFGYSVSVSGDTAVIGASIERSAQIRNKARHTCSCEAMASGPSNRC